MKYQVIYIRKQIKRDERVLCRIVYEFDNLTMAGMQFSRIVKALDKCELSWRIDWVCEESAAERWHDNRDKADITVSLEEVAE